MSSTTYLCKIDLTAHITVPNQFLKEYLQAGNTCAQDFVEMILQLCQKMGVVKLRCFGSEEEPAVIKLLSIDDVNIEGEDDDAEDGFWDDTFGESPSMAKSAPKETEEAQKHLTTSQVSPCQGINMCNYVNDSSQCPLPEVCARKGTAHVS